MPETDWMESSSPAFRLMIATSWLAPASWLEWQNGAIKRACSSGLDWAEYLRLVDRHRIPALSWAALQRVQGIEIPDHISKELRERANACRMQAIIQLQSLAKVLRAFNQACLPVMPLKGPLLSLDIYGDAGIRQSKDLDILVAQEDFRRAQACLEEIGWLRESDDPKLTPRQSEFRLRHEHHVSYVHASQRCHLELHWRVDWDTSQSAAARMAGGVVSQWQGYSYHALNPLDLLLFLCDHGSGHAWSRAKWLGDLARICTSQELDWQAALEKAHNTGQERSLLMCLRLLKDAYNLPVADMTSSQCEALPPALIDRSIRKLTAYEEPQSRSALANVMERVRSYRYTRLLRPSEPWLERFAEIAISTADFMLIRLPDSLFWLYMPLRPFLFVWRCLKNRAHNHRFSPRRGLPASLSLPDDGTLVRVATDAHETESGGV